MSKCKRLFCTGVGPTFRYTMAYGAEEANSLLDSVDAHRPDPDEMRTIWLDERLHEKTPAEIQARFGVSRQAVSNWRQKAGTDLPNYQQNQAQLTRDRILSNVDPSLGISGMAKKLGVCATTIRTVLTEANIKIPNKILKKPDDDTIVQLAHGRTWRELADACNVTLGTLRNYVYSKPELSKKVRAAVEHEVTGAHAHGKVHVDRLIQLHADGMSDYAISKEIGVQQMTVKHWVRKLGLRNYAYRLK